MFVTPKTTQGDVTVKEEDMEEIPYGDWHSLKHFDVIDIFCSSHDFDHTVPWLIAFVLFNIVDYLTHEWVFANTLSWNLWL